MSKKFTPEESALIREAYKTGGKEAAKALKAELGKKQFTGTKGSECKVEVDADGKVLGIVVPQGNWVMRQSGQNEYFYQKANSLLSASEILKKIDSVPERSYYKVETPYGTLGRDMNGFYTESPLKTKNLANYLGSSSSEGVEFSGLRDFGNPKGNYQSIAYLKSTGQYAKLVLLMECGRCGYESPVETEAGSLVRECYCCGTENTGNRGNVNLLSPDFGKVEI